MQRIRSNVGIFEVSRLSDAPRLAVSLIRFKPILLAAALGAVIACAKNAAANRAPSVRGRYSAVPPGNYTDTETLWFYCRGLRGPRSQSSRQLVVVQGFG